MSDRIECKKVIDASITEPQEISARASVLNVLRSAYSRLRFTADGDGDTVRVRVYDACSAVVAPDPKTGNMRRHGICLSEALEGLGFTFVNSNDSPCRGCELRN